MSTLHMHFDRKHDIDRSERIGCRGVLLRDNKILMSYETKTGKWMIPGGGLESGESLAQCCTREMSEETGIVVIPREHALSIIEYFDSINYINHYYLCDYVCETDRNPTANELEKGMVPKWIDLDEIIAILSQHEVYEQDDPCLCGLYRREYNALSYLKAQLKTRR